MSVTNTFYENLAAIKHGISDSFNEIIRGNTNVIESSKNTINEFIDDVFVLAKYAGVKIPKSFFDSLIVIGDERDADDWKIEVIDKIESLQELALKAENKEPFTLAIFRTPNFEFSVISKNDDLAAISIRQKWMLHASDTGANFDYFDENLDSISYHKIVYDQAIYT